MKIKTVLLSVTLILILAPGSEFISNAQEPIECKVLMSDISGAYKGDCKKGYANGVGEATGKDFYSGEFKNGLPNGKGKYVWANGDTYNGEWKKGKMEGFGEMKRKLTERDTVFSGYWLENEYIGKEQNPYLLNQKGTNIINVNFVRLNGEKNEIEISYSKNGKPIPAYSFGVTELIGRYGNIIKSDYAKTLVSVTFPFRAEIYGGAYFIDCTINQKGKWRITVNVTEK